MKKKKYIETGQCIWCLKREPKVSFFNKPHTISKKLGATRIGFDICDSCNYFFGTIDREQKYPMSVELAFKEIMNIMRLLLKNDLSKETFKTYRSVYFSYHHSDSTLRIKKTFKLNPYFIGSLTRQFKKGIFETFLQEYHRETKNGLDERFNSIRKFVRFDIGNPPLYFLENNGVHLVEESIDNLGFHFPENDCEQIDSFGFCTMLIYSNVFFLEVTPRAELSRETFLKKESKKLIGSGFIYTKLKELEYITDIDFTLRKLHGKK